MIAGMAILLAYDGTISTVLGLAVGFPGAFIVNKARTKTGVPSSES